MTDFIHQLAQEIQFDLTQVVGYLDDEIKKLERLYDVVITGQMRSFLSEMGRSGGGLIGDDPIVLYREKMSVRRHVLASY
ncbi:MAG: hypothetical protein P8X74_19570 [Reinekea sp.]